jgi:inner membrane protease subunit 2
LVVDIAAVGRGRSPRDHRELMVKRLIALSGDWIQIPEKQEIRQIPLGHCWVEGDNAALSFDSRSYGPVSYSSRYWTQFHRLLVNCKKVVLTV